VAPQTRSWRMVHFSRAPICGATNKLVENGSFQSRSYLWRHKHARGKWFTSVALLFVAPQTRSWKMVHFSPAPICGATNTLVEKGPKSEDRAGNCRVVHVIHRRYQGVFYFQYVIGFHGTRLNVMSLTRIKKNRPFLRRFSTNSQMLNNTYADFYNAFIQVRK
jgi:hypothetical protein